MYAATAILGALYERAGSGAGQHIDLALLDSQLGWLANQSLNYLLSGQPPGRHGSAHPNIAPYQAFATCDGFLMLAVGNDRQFASCCRALGLEELTRDARFADNAQRVAHRPALVARLAAQFATRSSGEWLEILKAAQVPCGPINDIAQAFAEPQVRHRGLRLDLPHALGVLAPGVRNPVRFSRNALEYQLAPPTLGQHTEEVLAQRLGLTAAELAQLRGCGALGKVHA
jgi:formyl-CoA transferase